MLSRVVLLISVLLLLCSCALSSEHSKSVSEVESPVEGQVPILVRFSSEAEVGAEAYLEGTPYGNVNAKIMRAYDAASGRSCRSVRLVTPAGCEIDISVCLDEDGVWRQNPPLWNTCP